MKTYAVINQKGGVGKTTSAAAIGEGMMREGRSVLFIDLDAQGNLSYSMKAATASERGAYSVLTGGPVTEEIQHTARGDVIASAPQLAFADSVLRGDMREFRLKDALNAISGAYDVCVIDCPPALGILTINALTAADAAIIPANADAFSLHGLGQVKATIESVRARNNPELRTDGIVLTRFNGRQVLSRTVLSAMEKKAAEMRSRVYQTRIRECIALREAQTKRQSIYEYAPKSHAAKDYAALVKEIMA